MVGIPILCSSLLFLNTVCQAAGYYKTDSYKQSNANSSSQNLALSSSQPFIGPEVGRMADKKDIQIDRYTDLNIYWTVLGRECQSPEDRETSYRNRRDRWG
jgi:hypothetical protein